MFKCHEGQIFSVLHQVDLTVQVDEKILGGLQVLIGDKFLDLSVSSRIADLSATIE